jgi:hypothetical protein
MTVVPFTEKAEAVATSRAEYVGLSSLMPYPLSYISAHKIAPCEHLDKTGLSIGRHSGFHLADALPHHERLRHSSSAPAVHPQPSCLRGIAQVSSQNISPISRPRSNPHENPIQNIFAWDIGLGGIGIPLSVIIPSTALND